MPPTYNTNLTEFYLVVSKKLDANLIKYVLDTVYMQANNEFLCMHEYMYTKYEFLD